MAPKLNRAKSKKKVRPHVAALFSSESVTERSRREQRFALYVTLTSYNCLQQRFVTVQVNLASVLVQTDMECLLSDLKTLQNERPTTVSNKAELQALCVPLQKVCIVCIGWFSNMNCV